jgi:hypothetical protein
MSHLHLSPAVLASLDQDLATAHRFVRSAADLARGLLAEDRHGDKAWTTARLSALIHQGLADDHDCGEEGACFTSSVRPRLALLLADAIMHYVAAESARKRN